MPVSNKAITVTRTELALSTLDINDEATYYLLFEGFSSGGGRWQRNMVESPYTDGEYEVGKRLRNSEVSMALAVKGATSTALDTALAALIHPDTGAFTAQYDYQVSVVIDGLTRTWRCYAAEWEIDWKGNWIDGIVNDLGPYYAPVALAIPGGPFRGGLDVTQTNGGKNLTIRALFGDDHSVVIPTPLYVALMATAPAAADDGLDLDEPTPSEYPAYDRVAVDNDDTHWTISADEASNVLLIVFPSSAASGGTVVVTYFAVTTSPSAGEVLVWGNLPTPITIGAASVLPRFPAGTLRITSADPIPVV